jgi:hypothetical protein
MVAITEYTPWVMDLDVVINLITSGIGTGVSIAFIAGLIGFVINKLILLAMGKV